ncbi:hypothetical protein B0H13DRAFT_1879262 [Mycena leptocephala]|nr:hypothetical protein B0H13DRAFT_1879262 [Mycena leptocephala]
MPGSSPGGVVGRRHKSRLSTVILVARVPKIGIKRLSTPPQVSTSANFEIPLQPGACNPRDSSACIPAIQLQLQLQLQLPSFLPLLLLQLQQNMELCMRVNDIPSTLVVKYNAHFRVSKARSHIPYYLSEGSRRRWSRLWREALILPDLKGEFIHHNPSTSYGFPGLEIKRKFRCPSRTLDLSAFGVWDIVINSTHANVPTSIPGGGFQAFKIGYRGFAPLAGQLDFPIQFKPS